MALFHRKPKAARVPSDPGLAMIDAWHKAYTAFNAERLASWPAGESLDAERATVAARGTAIVEALRADYLARTQR